MHGQRRHGHFLRDGLEHGARLGRGAHADGVAQGNFVATEVVQAARHAHYVAHRYVALVRAAEHGGNVAAHAHAIRPGMLEYRLEAFDGFVDRGVDVLAVERFTGRGEYRDVLGLDFARALVALDVRHQHRVIHAGAFVDAAVHLRGVGHLRNPGRIDEAGGLDGAQAGTAEPVDQLDLGPRRHDGALVLQAVARADFDDADGVGHRGSVSGRRVMIARTDSYTNVGAGLPATG